MARLSLQTKGEENLVIERKISSKDPNYIQVNDPSNFNLLRDNRHNDESFSRVDRFMVNHYWRVGIEILYERIFYPSQFGFEEIEDDKYHPYKNMCNQLIKKGIGLYGDRPIPQIRKPVQRLTLECRPKRMKLECKD